MKKNLHQFPGFLTDIREYVFQKFILWLRALLPFEECIKIEKLNALDPNSSEPFLRNEFLKIFEQIFMMTLFVGMTHIYDRT